MKNTFMLLAVVFSLTASLKAQPSLDWVKQIGGSFDDVGNAIAVDNAGNIYVAGTFSTTVDFDPGPETYTMSVNGTNNSGGAIFILKLDPSGQFIWAKQLPGWYQAYSGLWTQVTTIQMSNSKDLYIGGTFTQPGDYNPGAGTFSMSPGGTNSDKDIFICKLDTGGNFVWATQLGGIYNDEYKSMACDGSGNIFLSGTFQGTVDFDNGPGTATLAANSTDATFICKLDSSANFVWVKQLSDGNSFCHGLSVDASGNILATGESDASVDFDPGAGVVTHTAGGFVLKLNSSGSYLWSDAQAGAIGRSVCADQYGNVCVAGKNIFSKYTSGGTLSWSLSQPEIIGLMVDANGKLYASGTTTNNDLYIAVIDGSGTTDWSSVYGGPDDDKAHFMCHDNNGNIYVTGEFRDVSDLDPGAGVASYTATTYLSRADIFIQKLNSDFRPMGIQERSMDDNISIYPNPSAAQVFITSKSAAKATIYDSKGSIVKEVMLNSGQNSLSVTDLGEGLYFIRIEAKDQSFSRKLIVTK
jgi:hypothetical protein